LFLSLYQDNNENEHRISVLEKEIWKLKNQKDDKAAITSLQQG
jgi:uncharacterized small protein (DUF1192 family)